MTAYFCFDVVWYAGVANLLGGDDAGCVVAARLGRWIFQMKVLRRAQILWWNVRRFGALNIVATPTVAARSESRASLLHSRQSGAGFSERGLLRPRLSHDAKF